jgi:aspartyl-tRNA(Asn)/glutamyl-tRNA(Gln) amidotransferase subunit A
VLPVDYESAPEVEGVFEDALRVLRKAGMKMKRAELPALPIEELTRTLLNGEMAAAHEELIGSERLEELVDAGQKEGLKKNLAGSVAAYARAGQQREPARRAVLSLFEQFDALVAPTMVGEATTLDTNLTQGPRGRRGYSVLGALAGVPCLSVPMGFGKKGLPLGLSLTGNLFDENTLLAIGMAFQRETDWHRRRPPVD